MGLLDIPRGLISRLPLIGGSDDAKADEAEEEEKPVAEAEPADEPDEPDEPEDEQPVEDEPDEPEDKPDDDEAPSDDGTEDISGTTAPSIGPNTVIEKDSPEERLAKHEQSDTDAMGMDKRRTVIGGSYSASFGKQLTRWFAVVVIVVAAAFGLKLLVADVDKAPAHPADTAPWSGTDKAPPPLE